MSTDTGPEEHLEWIHDKAGRRYRLHISDSSGLWVLKVYDGRVLVAESKCVRRQDELLVGDLLVFDAAKHPQTPLARALRLLTRRGPRSVNYRGRGLGTALLTFIIERAVAKGLSRLRGNLFPRDLRANPNLPGWYRGFGFAVDMKSPESGAISLVLPPARSHSPSTGR